MWNWWLYAFLEENVDSRVWGSIPLCEDLPSFQSRFSSWLSLLELIPACKNCTNSPLLRSIPFQNYKLVVLWCMWVWAVTFVALFWQRLTGPPSSGHTKHQELPRASKPRRVFCMLLVYMNQFHLQLIPFLEEKLDSRVWGSISFGENVARFQSAFSSWLSWIGLILAYKNYMKSLLLRSIPFQN